jgi:hypothetical protein
MMINSLTYNAGMGPAEVRQHCAIDATGKSLLRAVMQQLHMSARACADSVESVAFSSWRGRSSILRQAQDRPGRKRTDRDGTSGRGDPGPAAAADVNRMETKMGKPITIQNLDDAITTWIEKEAERRGLSVETIVLELIHQGIKSSWLRTYHDLDALAGTWSDQETDEFLGAIADFEQVDEKLWQ